VQNQYAGDIHDFAKFLLLGRLKGVKIGIVWLLFPDEDNGDGRHRCFSSYSSLKIKGEETKKLAELLEEFYCRIVCDKRDPSVAELWPLVEKYLEKRGVEVIFPDKSREGGAIEWESLYIEKPEFSGKGEKRRRYREEYMARHLRFFKENGCEVVFFDPDTGLRVEKGNGKREESAKDKKGKGRTSRIKKSTKYGGKYIFWDEVTHFLKEGMGIIIYDSLPKDKKHEEFIKDKSKEILEKLKELEVLKKEGEPPSVYGVRFEKIQPHFYWIIFPWENKLIEKIEEIEKERTLSSFFKVYKDGRKLSTTKK